jgi:hypothetical protein
MSLSAEQRELLLNGPGVNGHRHDLVKAFDGSASLWVAWRRHRQELLDLCPHGRRPYGYWLVEERLPFVPRDETAQLRAIRAADCYRSDSERRFVLKRLSEITDEIRARRDLSRVA